MPKIASFRVNAKRGAGLLSIVNTSAVPQWARSIHPRRFAHNWNIDHHGLDETQSDTFDTTPSHLGRYPTTWTPTRPNHDHLPLPLPSHQKLYPEENEQTESMQATSSSPSTLHPEKEIKPGREENNQKIVELLDTRLSKRRPASKTVLNGGLSHRERTQRKDYLKRLEETVGIKEALFAQRRFEKEDAIRKEKRKALVAKLRPYIAKQLRLIELEAEEQRSEVEARKTWSIEKLIKEGWALDELEGFWLQKEKKEKKSGQNPSYSAIRTALFNRPGKAKLGWTKIQKGDQVELKKTTNGDLKEVNLDFENDSSSEDICIGTVRSITENEIRLNFETPFHDLDLIAHSNWRIEMTYNDLIEERLKVGVEALLHDVEATRRAGAELSGTSLVEMLLEGGGEEEEEKVREKAKEMTIAKWIKQNRESIKEPEYGPLNKTQRRAVEMMFSEPISLIQGPPGTGKTSTIVAAIRILKQHYKIPHPILLTSHTNVAVDNLAQGCKEAGLNVIRAGSMVKVRESLSDVTVEGLMEKHSSKSRLDELEANKIETIKSLQELQGDPFPSRKKDKSADVKMEANDNDDLEWLLDASLSSSSSNNNNLYRLQKKLSLLMQKSFVLRREMEADIFRDVDVVCCTALSAPLLRIIDFPIVFFDEASMATEPVTIATMIKGCQQLSLIGDQQQLSPLVKSREVIEEGLGLSLFERLMNRGDLPSVLLSTQHRMHPSLSDFPNREFYSNRLSDAKATISIELVDSSFIKAGKHLSFIDHKGKERITKNKSLENKKESELLMRIIANILCKNEDISGSDVGIITPYLGQKELVWKSLQEPTSYYRTLLAKEIDRLGGSRSRLAEIGDIEIHTIDGFEGREKKVIIFSLVRANAFKYLGFLKEEKRWNVALTRAKNALIIVGNASMLERSKSSSSSVDEDKIEQDSFLHRYADHLKDQDCVIAAEDVK